MQKTKCSTYFSSTIPALELKSQFGWFFLPMWQIAHYNLFLSRFQWIDIVCVLSSIENTYFFRSISSFCDVNAWRRRRNCLRCLLLNMKKTNILQMPCMKNRHTLGLITAGAGTKWNSGMKTRRASTYIHFWYRPW